MSEEGVNSSENIENVFTFKDSRTGFDPYLSYEGDKKENPDGNVIVMDNGENCSFKSVLKFKECIKMNQNVQNEQMCENRFSNFFRFERSFQSRINSRTNI